MKVIRSRDFKADRPWGACEVARVDAVTARLHWTDSAYRWHANDGDELFVVLDGTVDMRVRHDGVETVITLNAGDVFFGEQGLEHSARPRGEARILVVERETDHLADAPAARPGVPAAETGASTREASV